MGRDGLIAPEITPELGGRGLDRVTSVKSPPFCLEVSGVVVFARTSDSDERGKDISAFLVPLDLPGVGRERYPDMGSKAVQRGAAHLDGVRIPAQHLIGDEGQGFCQVMHGFDLSRALSGLQCIGLAQVTVDEPWET
jgi:cyclohexanecarboxyl-CoA dehydrogenase